MKNLLYKEFKLAISPLFYLVALLGGLVLIPNWPYFLALMYCLFITIPNVFSVAKAQNDIGFSVMLPVRKRDVVRARVMSIIVLELLHILVTAVFAMINSALYPQGNFLLDANIAFFGFAFVMFAIFNAIYFPMFYKTAYKIGIPIIAAFAAAFVFASGIELLVLFVPGFAAVVDGTQEIALKLAVLAGGIVIFVLLNIMAYKISANRFEKLDL